MLENEPYLCGLTIFMCGKIAHLMEAFKKFPIISWSKYSGVNQKQDYGKYLYDYSMYWTYLRQSDRLR